MYVGEIAVPRSMFAIIPRRGGLALEQMSLSLFFFFFCTGDPRHSAMAGERAGESLSVLFCGLVLFLFCNCLFPV